MQIDTYFSKSVKCKYFLTLKTNKQMSYIFLTTKTFFLILICCLSPFYSYSQNLIDTSLYVYDIPKEEIKKIIELKKNVQKIYANILDSIFTKNEQNEFAKYLTIHTSFYFGYFNGVQINRDENDKPEKCYSVNTNCIDYLTKDTLNNTSTSTLRLEKFEDEEAKEAFEHAYKVLIIQFLNVIKVKKEIQNNKNFRINVVYQTTESTDKTNNNLIKIIDDYSFKLLLNKQSLKYNIFKDSKNLKFKKKDIVFFVKPIININKNGDYDIHYDFKGVNYEVLLRYVERDTPVNKPFIYPKNIYEKGDVYWLYRMLYKKLGGFISYNLR